MPYIETSILERFRNKKDDFDYKRLIGLLEQLNSNYSQKNEYGCFLLIKAILNHIPPLLGYRSFKELTSRYKGWASEAHSRYATQLRDFFLDEAHDVSHTPISDRKNSLLINSVSNVRTHLNTVLEECLTKTSGAIPIFKRNRPSMAPSKGVLTKIEVVDSMIRWNNYPGFTDNAPSFEAKLLIDNSKNNFVEHIDKVEISLKKDDGDRYISSRFKFEGKGVGERLRVGAQEIIDTIVLVPVDFDQDALKPPFHRPNADLDKYKLIITFHNSGKICVDIKRILDRFHKL